MERLDSSAIRSSTISGSIIRPSAVGAVCAGCNEKVVFTLSDFSQPGPQRSVSAVGSCPSCSNRVGFWALNPTGIADVKSVQLYMSPSPKDYFHNPDGLEQIPVALKNALVATIECYNAKIYTATAVAGRRTLEGIFKYLVGEDKRNLPLFKLIEVASKERDLSAPLSMLSHAIRAGGNLGAHFDMEHEPDEKVARQIVELLCYLISYLYVLPAKIEQLEKDLTRKNEVA